MWRIRAIFCQDPDPSFLHEDVLKNIEQVSNDHVINNPLTSERFGVKYYSTGASYSVQYNGDFKSVNQLAC
jgi:hypothetical protein